MNNEQIQMYSIGQDDDDGASGETVVLRSLNGNSTRPTAMVQRSPRNDLPLTDREPVTLYTLDTPEPIPRKALPKNTRPDVFYIENHSTRPTDEIETRSSIETTVYFEPHVVSQPIFYSIAGPKPRPIIEERIPKTAAELAESSPILYRIAGRPRRPTIDIDRNPSPMPTTTTNTPAVLYTVVASPRPSPQPSMTNQQLVPTTPNFYSIVGTPTRTSRGTQVELATPYEPAPILYTIVGDTPEMNNENRPSPRPKKNDVIIYGPNNEIYASNTKSATLYNVASQPRTPLVEVPIPTKVATPRKATPPPPPVSPMPKRTVGNIDRTTFETKHEVSSEDILTYPSGKTSIPTNSKESTPSKNETNFVGNRTRVEPIVPLTRSTRPSHGFRTQKPHQDRKIPSTTLPAVPGATTSNRSLYRTVQPKATSLERRRTRPMHWDHDWKNQTDDDEIYEDQMNKKKRIVTRPKARAPWVPVW